MQLPRNWYEISIEKYLKYHTVITSNIIDPIDLEVKVLSCLSDLPESEVLNVKAKDLPKLVKQIEFLKHLPSERIPMYFKCGKNKYKASILTQDMTAGQIINFSQVCKDVKPEDYIYSIADLMGCMCVKRETGIFFEGGKLSFTRYKYKGYKEASADIMKNMSIGHAYPYFVFFCKVMKRLPIATLDYLTGEVQRMNPRRKGLRSIGAGIAWWIRYRITILLNGR